MKNSFHWHPLSFQPLSYFIFYNVYLFTIPALESIFFGLANCICYYLYNKYPLCDHAVQNERQHAQTLRFTQKFNCGSYESSAPGTFLKLLSLCFLSSYGRGISSYSFYCQNKPATHVMHYKSYYI